MGELNWGACEDKAPSTFRTQIRFISVAYDNLLLFILTFPTVLIEMCVFL